MTAIVSCNILINLLFMHSIKTEWRMVACQSPFYTLYYACDKLKVSYRRINQTIVGIFQVLVWKTNFDQMDFSELLKTHKQRSEADPAPTVADIAPKVQRPTSSSTTSSRGTGKVNFKLYQMSDFMKLMMS